MMLFIGNPKILHKHGLQFLLGVKMAPQSVSLSVFLAVIHQFIHLKVLVSYTYIHIAWENSRLSRLHHWFSHEMTSEKRTQKFHTDDAGSG